MGVYNGEPIRQCTQRIFRFYFFVLTDITITQLQSSAKHQTNKQPDKQNNLEKQSKNKNIL